MERQVAGICNVEGQAEREKLKGCTIERDEALLQKLSITGPWTAVYIIPVKITGIHW